MFPWTALDSRASNFELYFKNVIHDDQKTFLQKQTKKKV